jgi:hypothetical protein
MENPPLLRLAETKEAASFSGSGPGHPALPEAPAVLRHRHDQYLP